jgi:hypothetical protein
LRFASTHLVRFLSRHRSRAVFLSRGVLPLLFLIARIPTFSQAVPPEPDPLARIRAESQAQTQACSEAEPTLCAEAAPKIIANAMGSDSTIQKNLSILASGEGGHAMGAPAPQSVVDDVRVTDWAVAAFRAAGLDVHTESYAAPSNPAGSAPGQQAIEQENVVAEIRGREKPDEIVILGAHLDTSVPANGALDDYLDAAVVIEAARDIVATGLVPRRTIRFVLFSANGDDSRMPASWAYARDHRDEMDRTIAAIIFDEGAGHIASYSLGGRHDIEPGVREALVPLDSLGALVDTFDAPLAADDLDFLLEGVPNLLVSQGSARIISNFHPMSATLENLDFGELKRHAAIAGVTAFDVAEDVAPLGPRLSRAEIETLLTQSGLDQQMKTAGIWPLWESGQRGRQP